MHTMARRNSLAALSAFLFLQLACAEIKLQSVDRKINLNSQFVRITETYKVKNPDTEPATKLTLCSQTNGGAIVAYQKVKQTASSKKQLQATSTSVAGAPAGVSCWEVTLQDPIPSGEVANIERSTVVVEAQTPYPKEIQQTEAQLMLYFDNVYVVSPYHVSQQTTEVTLPGASKSYTEEKPTSKSDNKIKYGKYDKIKPFTMKELKVHYESNKAFKKAISAVREIEVSHWGNIYVEESYEVMNAGSKHKGSFSRLKYAHSYNGKTNSFRDLRARLPAPAHSLYYVDLIGNISSSNTRKSSAETTLDIDLRYPLMGSWKADFMIGYSVPLKNFLFKKRSDGKRRLTIDFSTPFEDLYIEDLTVKVVLPEGSSSIKAILPYAVDQGFDTKYTYLDTTGRPVMVLHKKHVVPEHATKLNVDYSFYTTSMIREPLMLISAFATLFLAAILYNHMEFTISKDEKWQEAQRAEKLATVMQAVNGIIDEQDEVLDTISLLTASIRSSADVDHAGKERRSLENALASLDAKARPLVQAVEGSSPRVGEKLVAAMDKARALQARFFKALAERCELVGKGSSVAEVNKKMAPTVQQLQEARAELSGLMETLFAPY